VVKGKMVVLSEINGVLLNHSAMDICSDGYFVSIGYRVNDGSVYTYCSTVTSQCYGYMD
jgi:hypothetical protein